MTAQASSSKPMSIILTLVLGVLGGSLGESVFGFCSGALLGFLLAQVFTLRQRVRLLDEQFEVLKASREPPAWVPPAIREKPSSPAVEKSPATVAEPPVTPAAKPIEKPEAREARETRPVTPAFVPPAP